jgi:hypothetical protein
MYAGLVLTRDGISEDGFEDAPCLKLAPDTTMSDKRKNAERLEHGRHVPQDCIETNRGGKLVAGDLEDKWRYVSRHLKLAADEGDSSDMEKYV